MSLGTMEQRTEGMKRQAQELIEQAYQRGYNAGYEEGKGQTWSEEIKKYEIEPDKKREYIEQGRNEAWEAARKICCCGEKCLTSLELEDIFCTNYSRDIILQNTASEAISKIKAYEEYKKQEEDNELHVGDEVSNAAGDIGVVMGISNNDVSLFIPAWNISQITHKACCKKTGRKFPEIAEVLKKLQEEINE